MTPEQKPWGWTAAIAREADHHIDRISVQPGGYCSVHRHMKKANVFHVLAGRLYVKQFSEHGGGSLAARHLGPGDSFVVPVGIWHQFHAQNGHVVEALELYLPGPEGGTVDAADIERHAKLAVGGIGSYGELFVMWKEAFKMEAPAV